MSRYSIGDKFIIEIDEVFYGDMSVKGNTLYRVKGFRSLVFDKTGLDNLERLDGDYVNENLGELQDEAYEAGRKAGQEEAIQWSQKNEADMYDAGLNDAWELAKKIALSTSMVETAKIFIAKNICAIGQRSLFEDCFALTPQEALAKLETYEKEQAEIKVGDVVSHDGLKAIVVRVADNCIYTISLIGTTPRYSASDMKKLKKTGKHIDISTILAEIGKE